MLLHHIHIHNLEWGKCDVCGIGPRGKGNAHFHTIFRGEWLYPIIDWLYFLDWRHRRGWGRCLEVSESKHYIHIYLKCLNDVSYPIRWVEDNSLVDNSFTNWQQGRPLDSESKNCMWSQGGGNTGSWLDESCTTSSYAICSKPIVTQNRELIFCILAYTALQHIIVGTVHILQPYTNLVSHV